jgi:hypothetical protein
MKMNKASLAQAYQRLRARRRAMAQLGIVAAFRPGKRMMEIEPLQPYDHLRLVGYVFPDFRAHRAIYWGVEAKDHFGWHTDPHGDVFRDGSGLCWGVVYRLPARNKTGLSGNYKSLLVAGYQFGGCDFGVTLDTSQVFECEAMEYRDDRLGATVDAARHADSLAQEAAYKEREYQLDNEDEE